MNVFVGYCFNSFVYLGVVIDKVNKNVSEKLVT